MKRSGPTQAPFTACPYARRLALLPVFDLLGNSAESGLLGMPVTVLYCYGVFSLNCLLGLAYFVTRRLAWVEMESRRTEEGWQ
ncbi:hypothetical protein [Microbulbifer sp. S227A]|uniref:hypothetical protein n=1 Tax=Microbulbifer sp. S227A TaxID=3415131 RepID=UPI003C7A64DA